MSVMHILGSLLIGLVIGKLFATLTIRDVWGGRYSFMAVGIIGSILGDVLFRILFEYDLVSKFFQKQVAIMIEMGGGAFVACYILSLFGRKRFIAC